MLCTILFTDIVGSTARAESLGDAAWRALLERHHDVARQEIPLCDGHEVKTTGDGILVRFPSPARALGGRRFPFLRWSTLRMVLGAKHLLTNWSPVFLNLAVRGRLASPGREHPQRRTRE